jgi:hypothetical protein
MTARLGGQFSLPAAFSASPDLNGARAGERPSESGGNSGLSLSPGVTQSGKAWAMADRTRLLVGLLALAFLLVQGLGIYHQLHWYIIDRETIKRLEPIDLTIDGVGKEGQQAGFQAGDHLLQVGGEDIRSFLDYRKALNRQKPDRTVMLTVERGGTTLTLPASVKTEQAGILLILRQLVASAFLAIGTLVILQVPDSKVTRLFFVTVFALGLYFALQRTETTGLVYIQAVALTLTPGLTIHFFLTFPEERSVARTQWWFLLYVPSLILMALAVGAFTRSLAQRVGGLSGPCLLEYDQRQFCLPWFERGGGAR